jgi:hypothetical protein
MHKSNTFGPTPIPYLHHFIIYCMALKQVLMALKLDVVGACGDNNVFLEALFYCVSKRHPIFYAPDIDINKRA